MSALCGVGNASQRCSKLGCGWGAWRIRDGGRDTAYLGLTHFTVGVTLISSLKAATKTHDGFDYVELPLTPKSMEGFPKEYGGISGAGLWRLGEADAAARTVTWTDAVSLEGVALYHRRTAPEIVRCHGRRSIYRNLLDTVGT